MSNVKEAISKAISDICAARLCAVNSMSSRQEMLRLMIQATDILRAALEQSTGKQSLTVPAEAQTEAEKIAYCAGWWAAMAKVGEQEPVAWRHWLLVDGERFPQLTLVPRTDIDEPLYTRPPRREWQGLTDEEREQATGWSVEHIEAALKEKNK